MRELTVAKRQMIDEAGREHNYEYMILIDEMSISDQIRVESYGVKILEQEGESSELANITPSSARIESLLDLLVRNTVTPCTLRNVVEDWL